MNISNRLCLLYINLLILFIINLFLSNNKGFSKQSNLLEKYNIPNVEIFDYSYSSQNKLSNDFIYNPPILKSYGPLTIDINNINFKSNLYFVPSLNDNNKPFILAIDCDESLFNIKQPNGWNGWFSPFFVYELNILSEFCI